MKNSTHAWLVALAVVIAIAGFTRARNGKAFKFSKA